MINNRNKPQPETRELRLGLHPVPGVGGGLEGALPLLDLWVFIGHRHRALVWDLPLLR